MPPPPAPWRQHGVLSTHDYRIFRTTVLEVEHPVTGARHPRVTIEAPDWVNVVALTRDEEVVLVRQYRFGLGRNTLEIPGGMIDEGEAPLEAAARELEEETGFVPGQLEPLGACQPNPAIQTNQLHMFLATRCTRVHQGRPDEGEDLRVELLGVPALGALVRSGELAHALVLVALARAGAVHPALSGLFRGAATP